MGANTGTLEVLTPGDRDYVEGGLDDAQRYVDEHAAAAQTDSSLFEGVPAFEPAERTTPLEGRTGYSVKTLSGAAAIDGIMARSKAFVPGAGTDMGRVADIMPVQYEAPPISRAVRGSLGQGALRQRIQFNRPIKP